MSIRFIYGRAGSGKTSFCLNDILEKLKKDIKDPIYVIVPEQFSLQTEVKISKIIQSASAIKLNCVEVLSFKRLTYKIFNQTGGPQYPMLSKTGKSINLYKAINNVNDQLLFYKNCGNKQGYIKELANTISELKRYNIDSKNLEDIKEGIKGEKSYNRIKDLSIIYSEYENILSGDFLDPDDEMNILLDKIDSSSMFDNSYIFFDEFSGFTPQQLNIIKNLAIRAKQISFTVCTDYLYSDTDLYYLDMFSIPRITVDKIRSISDELAIMIEKPVSLSKSKRFLNKELIYLEKNIYNFNYREYDKEVNNIKMYAASNGYEEVKKTANEIIALCRENKYRFRDIGIIVGALEEYEKIIKVIFDEYNIPYFLDSNKDIFSNKLIMLLSSALEIRLNNWSYGSMFSYLKTGLVNLPMEKIDLLENYVISAGVKGFYWYNEESWKEKLEYIKDKRIFKDNELEEINEIRDLIVKPLTGFFDKLKNSNSMKENILYTYEFLEEIYLPKKLKEIIKIAKQAGNINMANEYTRVWDMLCTIFDEIYIHFHSDEKTDIKSYYQILMTAISSCEITLIPETVDQVNIGDIMRSKNKEVKALFILGANDGKLPCPLKDNGIIPDKVRNLFKEKGIELAPDSRIKTVEGNYQIYNALTKSQDKLYIYFSIADLAGKALRPSILISMIRNIFVNLKIDSDKYLNTRKIFMEELTLPIPSFKDLIINIRQACEEGKINNELVQICKWFYYNAQWNKKLIQVFKNFNFTNTVSNLGKESMAAVIENPVSTSVTKIQQFIQCPFSYYLKYTLNLKERETFELTYLDIGSLVHEALEIIFSKIDFNKEYSLEEINRICMYTLDDEMEKEKNKVFLSTNKNKYLLERNIKLLGRTIYVMYTHLKQSEFKPLGYEYHFHPLIVNVENVDLEIKGVIDRIDYYEEEKNCYIRIVDYKTGSRKLNLNDIYCGHNLQLTVYLNAIVRNGLTNINKNIIPCGVLYFNLHNPIIKTDGFNIEPHELEKRIIKELKMDGLVTDNVEVLKLMDENIEDESVYLPVKLKKDGGLHKASSVANQEQFNTLCTYSQKMIEKTFKRIIKGEIDIYPYRKKGITPCTYCNYKSICQFDVTLKGNKYNTIYYYKEEEIWENMKNNT